MLPNVADRDPEESERILKAAEMARALTLALNACESGHLAYQRAPEGDRDGGAFWYAHEALRVILIEYTGAPGYGERVLEEIYDNGESVQYNLRQLYHHHTQIGIWWTADIVTPDGSDSDVYGEPTLEGQGARHDSGWWYPHDGGDARYDVHDEREYTVPDLYDRNEYDDEQPERTDAVAWLVRMLEDVLPGGPEITGFNGSTFYSRDSDNSDYREGRTISAAAHPFGFTTEQLNDAVARIEAEREAERAKYR